MGFAALNPSYEASQNGEAMMMRTSTGALAALGSMLLAERLLIFPRDHDHALTDIGPAHEKVRGPQPNRPAVE